MGSKESYGLSAGDDLFSGGDEEVRDLFGGIRGSFNPHSIQLLIQHFPANRFYRLTWSGPGERFAVDQGPAQFPVPPSGALTLDVAAPALFSGRLMLCRNEPESFSESERRGFVDCRPYLERCIRQMIQLRRMADENRILLTVLDSSDTSIFLFDDTLQITYANNCADELLSRQTEELLAVSLTEDKAVKLLQFLLESIPSRPQPARGRGSRRSTPPSSPRENVPRRNLLLTNGTRFDMTVVPLVPREGDSRGIHYLVILREMHRFEMSQARPGLLQSGLSEREIEVVANLLNGLKNAEIAERLKISSYTVKDHLKHIFQKLGLRSRSELVSYVLQLSG